MKSIPKITYVTPDDVLSAVTHALASSRTDRPEVEWPNVETAGGEARLADTFGLLKAADQFIDHLRWHNARYVLGCSYGMRHVREPHDLDVDVHPDDWGHVLASGMGVETVYDGGLGYRVERPGLVIDVFKADNHFPTADFDYAKMAPGFEKDEYGNPTWSLAQTRAWKLAFGRPKDVADVGLIDAYLAGGGRRASRAIHLSVHLFKYAEPVGGGWGLSFRFAEVDPDMFTLSVRNRRSTNERRRDRALRAIELGLSVPVPPVEYAPPDAPVTEEQLTKVARGMAARATWGMRDVGPATVEDDDGSAGGGLKWVGGPNYRPGFVFPAPDPAVPGVEYDPKTQELSGATADGRQTLELRLFATVSFAYSNASVLERVTPTPALVKLVALADELAAAREARLEAMQAAERAALAAEFGVAV